MSLVTVQVLIVVVLWFMAARGTFGAGPQVGAAFVGTLFWRFCSALLGR